ncbi:ABC transporter ATP-binding protein [Staphylococcus devriesei]|uniref:Teichoic acid ABC transporter ATP-binding protein n=1 Tax=Staphylococcus devriesei TaxID=586733 RepID=A0A2T4KFD3_9STAP|nr:ATP-binding cassette domain-containing protein [Staphylococcus devriesei]MCE5090935.1 ABC transporter ATP-binding protein [Staphylococcus devriesei]PTE71153.1 teichoic acid ABC transporter ATP-binding protein [Staphylococcus devriesei]RIL70951.1 ABC transporter ATP-binding protein [Staphylococcus devriesei]WKU13817.1 ATP-binding cassette domain-containing protein [Staphylococcus devriesei]
MGSSIILKLLNVTHYYRNKKNRKWYLPFGYDAEDIELNKISLHIYQGEALAIIGEPGSSKTLLGRIIAGDIKPDRGKMVKSASTYYGDIKDKHLLHITVKEYVKDIQQLFTYETSSHNIEQIIKYAHLDEKASVKINELSHTEFAQLILSLARVCRAEVLILNHIIEHLDDSFLEKAKQLSKDYISDNQSLILIDDDINKVAQVSNYVAWISHGQVRMEGSLNQVLPIFKDHERDRLSIDNEEEQQNFDLDWKESRSRLPDMSYNFKRVERYKNAKVPEFVVKFWTILTTSVLALILIGALVMNNIGIIEAPTIETQKKVQNKDPFEEKLAYGIVMNDSITLNGASNIKIPKYTFVTITGENSKKYKVTMNDKDYEIGKSKLQYFNPAALYESHSLSTLAPYMKSNYSDYVDYFNSQLHKKHEQVKKTLVPDEDSRYVVAVTQQPIDMLFNDQNKLTGFVFPIVDKDKLKDKYHITQDLWIVKTDNGYLIADMNDSKWIYIEL